MGVLDWGFIKQYLPMYIEAAKLTISIGAVGILFSLLIGLFCSLGLYYKVPVLRRLIAGYVEVARNTPLLVQLFFLYFGLPKIGIVMSSQACAITGLAFLGGGYMTEAFRSSLEAIEGSQKEAALALGLTRGQVLRYVVLPQAAALFVPPLCANVIFLLKETSVFSVVALADLMFVAKDLIGLYYKTNEALFLLVLSYLAILLPISFAGSLLERRMRYAGFGN